MTYPFTFIVKSLQPNVGGCANGPIIRILEKYRNDRGIYEHEMVHVKQWFFTLGLHSFLYLLVPAYKLWTEVQAYREQAKYYDDDRLPLFATFISLNYGLHISQSDALERLRK